MINMKDKIKREVILMNLIAIDIGGTTIKIATWINQKLKMAFTIDTPDNLDTFYEELTDAVNEIKANHNIDGVAISSPGAVNKATGVIEGASALPYIHNFKIVPELEKRFGLPVSIENDANCAALAEIADGAAKGCSSMAFLVIGTGVGGSIIINNQIWHGVHLYGGEFGFMIIDGKQLSELASPVTMAKRYNKKTGKDFDGKTVFELADTDDPVAQEERGKLLHALAVAIFNIQHSFDPEKIIIGGGISQNPELVPLLDDEIAKLRNKMDIETVKPILDICTLKNEANLRGAVADFEKEH